VKNKHLKQVNKAAQRQGKQKIRAYNAANKKGKGCAVAALAVGLAVASAAAAWRGGA
jgi:enolase